MLEQNQGVKKPAEFKLQRVEKESWQQDESGRVEEKIEQKRKSRSPQLKRRKVSSDVVN